jgi:hypothetical protein
MPNCTSARRKRLFSAKTFIPRKGLAFHRGIHYAYIMEYESVLRVNMSRVADCLNHPTAGAACAVTGLIGIIITAPLCFGILAIPAILSSVVPFLLPTFVLACCIFAAGATMVGCHPFTKNPSSENQPSAQPSAPSQETEADPQTQLPPENPEPPPVVENPELQPETPPSGTAALKYPTPESYPPFTDLMPPLNVHSPTKWLQKAYGLVSNLQKIHLQIALRDGRCKDVYVMILRGNDLMANSGNSSGPHKDWDIITEAANEYLESGGNTAGITYNHYGAKGWKETATFKKFRTYQETRKKYFQEHAADFSTKGLRVPAHFQKLEIACGETLTNEGADHGKPHGFQALTHILGPRSDMDIPKLQIGYESLGRDTARLNAHSVHITGVSEAIFAQDPVRCAAMAIPGFLDAYVNALKNAEPNTVDNEPVFCVFGRYEKNQSYEDHDAPSSWPREDAAYRDNLHAWRDAHPEMLRTP